jgi:hypothetical protein
MSTLQRLVFFSDDLFRLHTIVGSLVGTAYSAINNNDDEKNEESLITHHLIVAARHPTLFRWWYYETLEVSSRATKHVDKHSHKASPATRF